MDLVAPILTIATDLFGCTAKCLSRVRGLRDNLECLRKEMIYLDRLREDVEQTVEVAKQQRKAPASQVMGWIQDVNRKHTQVDAILEEGRALLEKKCLGRCRNICSIYKLGKRVSLEIKRVRELKHVGDFEEVALPMPWDVVDELPLGHTVGVDSLYTDVCLCLAQDELRIVGLQGRPGSGKTTLMKKINNGLLRTVHQFDIVIWVSVSERESVKAAQEVIGNRLGIVDGVWPNRSLEEKAIQIFNFMKTKRFLLLLDKSGREPLHLLKIGVPVPDALNGSKVIIACVSRQACFLIKVDSWIDVQPLAEEYTWPLFIYHLSEEARKLALHNPEIKILAESMLAKCYGLPSAIVKAAQASAGLETVAEWRWSNRKLQDLISREILPELPDEDVQDEMPLGYTVGLDSFSAEVRDCLANDEVGILGLHGKRCIGKTTIMKKIHNGLMRTYHQFDIVIWVTVSEEACVCVAQEVIGRKLGIIDGIWPNRRPEEKATQIFNVLGRKRFLLLLDNVFKPLDLLEIGVPHPDTQEGSKVIISARNRDTCIRMKAGKLFEVKPLAKADAWPLFIHQRLESTRNLVDDNPNTKILAESIVAKCEGLPSAIIKAGQASAGFDTATEWQQSIEALEDLINQEISSGKDGRLSLEVVADEMPLGYTVGLDSLYQRVRKCLIEFQGAIIGLYGTGGVGKTTLMKKIYNEFSKATYPFDTVIWIPMSQLEYLTAAQEAIRSKLQIKWQSETVDGRSKEIFKIMKQKRFLLVLDDVRQKIDLFKLGVPPLAEIQNNSKIIIATRSLELCIDMEVRSEWQFRVEILAPEEALALFFKKVENCTMTPDSEILQLAEKVAGQCKGLPLALVIVGRAMATNQDNNNPEAWERAIEKLEKFPTEIRGVEDELFQVLKFSYDSLKDDTTKSCFIYYSFFPKGYEIRNDELIEHWIGQGFIGGDNMHEARRAGQKVIDNLKNACLFEEGDEFKECIKMHDVIHDMAIWIAQDCGKMMNKILVCESLDVADAERVTSWNEAKSILLWGKNVEKLPRTPHCANLHTLFVRECIRLKTFPSEFFKFMPLLKVLDLSATHCIKDLSDGIGKLVNLEYINLSHTFIRELPNGMVNLKKLRCLLLNGMPPLAIPPSVIKSLSSLLLLSMFDGNALSKYCVALIEELESMKHLNEISLSFRSEVALNKLLSSPELQRCMRRLSINDCQDLSLLVLSSIFLKYLEALVISNCPDLEEMIVSVEKEKGKLKQADDIPNLNMIVKNNQHFHGLRDVKIWMCPKLLNLTWLIYATRLQSLDIQFCKFMKEVIGDEYITSSTQNLNIFTRLKSIIVGGMPMLESLCHGTLLFPLLEVISVISCPRLRRLPFDPKDVPSRFKKIEGDLNWWGSLKWDETGMEEMYVVHFSPRYLADPVHPSGEKKGKKKLVIEGSTSSTTT